VKEIIIILVSGERIPLEQATPEQAREAIAFVRKA